MSNPLPHHPLVGRMDRALFIIMHCNSGAIGGVFSVALSVPFGPGRYPASCPAELGLSSPGMGAIIRSASPLFFNTIFQYNDKKHASAPPRNGVVGRGISHCSLRIAHSIHDGLDPMKYNRLARQRIRPLVLSTGDMPNFKGFQ